MNRIDQKFKELKKQGKAAFIAYLTVGYPDISTTEKLVLEMSKNGVDIFELGMPFSDPLADGPIIQEASAYALKRKVKLHNLFSLVKRLRKKIDNPLLLMGYYNPILHYGLEKFSKEACGCGLDGVIVADLPIEESSELRVALKKNGLHIVNFIAPTTGAQRIKKICALSGGFIYYVSLTGVTGTREKLPQDVVGRLKLIKKETNVPLCVGFGVSNREQFVNMSKVSDGVIVGSALISKIKENLEKRDLVEKVARFAGSFTINV